MKTGESIRVLIADDHAVVRRGLAALIGSESGMEVVGEAGDGQAAVDLASSLRPDVIVMDMMMPNKDGIEATEEIMRSDAPANILALTSFSEDHNVIPAVRAGALGYLIKDSSADELLKAIREVAEGRSFLQPSLGARLVNQLVDSGNGKNSELTPREVDILRHVASGGSNQEIADSLNLSERTVGKHVTNILDKLQLSNRTQAALYALRTGMVRLN